MVTIAQLTAKYPLLWHMADPRNIPGILTRGLLSTSALLDLLGLGPEERREHERNRRSDDIVFSDVTHGTVVLRDQKPLNIARLATALTTGSTEDFLAYINGRVFFWPTEKRLTAMNGARAYADRPQLVIVVRSAPLIAAHEKCVRLSRINSGATMPFAWARSIATFEKLAEYDWSRGRRQVAEITIEGGVREIWDHVERLEVWGGGELLRRLNRPWDASLERRVRR